MGSEVDWAADRGAIPVGIRAVGCDEIDRVEVIRNGEVVFSEKGEVSSPDIFSRTHRRRPELPGIT